MGAARDATPGRTVRNRSSSGDGWPRDSRARRRARPRGAWRPGRPRWSARPVRRVRRRGRLLRTERLPHHLAVVGRASAYGPGGPGGVLGAARSPVAACADGPGRRGGTRAAPLRAGLGRRPALRRPLGTRLGRELALRRGEDGLLRPGRCRVPAAAHLVPRRRGAVLPGVAAGADRGHRAAGPSFPRERAAAGDACHGGRACHRGRDRLGGRGGVAERQRRSGPGLLRQRHPCAGAAGRCRRGGGVRAPLATQRRSQPACRHTEARAARCGCGCHGRPCRWSYSRTLLPERRPTSGAHCSPRPRSPRWPWSSE